MAAGTGAAALALVAAPGASAASVPLTITFGSGTTTIGSLPALTTATTAAPATFAGQIDATTYQASFPASGIALPSATRTGVSFGTSGTGDLTVAFTPSAFTGTINTSTLSLDLTGTIGYAYTAKIGTATYGCTSSSPVTLAGGPLDLTTGTYSVSGTHANLLLTPVDLASTTFCLTGLTPKVTGSTNAQFAGKLAIPGLIPATVPPGVPPTTPPPAKPPTTAPPATTSPTTKRPKLRLTLGKLAPVARGEQVTLTIKLSNPGSARARSVAVRITPPKGVRASKTTLRFSSLPRKRTRTLRVRLRATDQAAASSTVAVSATAGGGLRASRTRTLRVR